MADSDSKTAPTGRESLAEVDPELAELIKREAYRQASGLELIASENFTSAAVLECLGSCLTNKYSEGYPGKRYYGGNEVIDQIEELAIRRALAAYKLDAAEWGVNVQPYSGSPANFAVYTALLQPNDRIMGLDLPSGGHLTHGYYTTDKDTHARKPVSASSIFFQSMPYHINKTTGLIDYDGLEAAADTFRPKLLICGGSSYAREWDYPRFRKIANACGAILMMDMAHVSGLVAAGVVANPFEFCDIVTTTTHKTLRGPRAGMIFYRKKYEAAINSAVFPSLQGGPHENQIAGIATQLREVASPAFQAYAVQVVKNAKALGAALMSRGYKMVTDGTDCHFVVWDLRALEFTGSKMEKICDAVHISVNKNTVYGDKNAVAPGGIRIGSPALTTRGFTEADMEQVADFLDRTVKAGIRIQRASGSKLADFVEALATDAEVAEIGAAVQAFALKFPIPGFAVPSA